MPLNIGSSGRGHRGRIIKQRTILGIEELDKRLEGLELAVANRVARKALTSAASLAAKKIKAEIPGKHKGARRAIGSSVKKAKRGRNKGWTEAKAGAAVGKKPAKQKAEAEKAKSSRKKGRGGVGISAANIHWYLKGTQQRRRKAGQSTGMMPANDAVARAIRKGKGAIVKRLKDETWRQIDIERLKLVKKYMIKWHGNAD